jgi:glycosyltransferase involved in cell wall biosynthesis
MSRLRILLLGPDCDPTRVSIPFVTYSHAAALAKLNDVSLVIGAPVEDHVRGARAPFHSIEVVRMPTLERLFDFVLRRIFKNNYDTQVLTAFSYPFSIAFEWFAWRQLRKRILKGEFDVVLRLLPMAPSMPSPFAYFLRKGPIPFVIGPLNGGLPWPSGFSQLQKQKEWISSLRNVYRHLPFAKSTYRYAAAIIAASSQVYSEFTRYRDKVFFVPEPGISDSLCCGDVRPPRTSDRLELLFVGGLVPRKACDLALRAAAELLREGSAHLAIVGDGPERQRLEQLATTLGLGDAVDFTGWISHAEVLARMRAADVFLFPTLRDNGAGVVFEALASGAVPVVVDFGGPGDIVHPGVGYKVPLTNEDDVVSRIQRALMELVQDRGLLEQLRKNGVEYARTRLTWDAKAQDTTKVLQWVAGQGPKPSLLPPKILAAAD